MAKVETLLILTLIAVVQMYEMDFGGESAEYHDDFSDIDMKSDAGSEIYRRLVKRNGPIWRPKFVNSPGLTVGQGGRCFQWCSSPNTQPQNGPWNPIKTPKAPNGPWKVSKVSMTSGGDYDREPVWVKNVEEIFKPLNTMNGEQIILEMEDPRGNGMDVSLSCHAVPKEIETPPIEPIQTFFMDERKRDVVKQAYSKDPKQERPSSKSAEGNLGAKDKAKGQVINIIRKTIKPDLNLKKQNSLKTDVTKAT